MGLGSRDALMRRMRRGAAVLLVVPAACGSPDGKVTLPAENLPAVDLTVPRIASLRGGSLYSVEQTEAGLVLTRRPATSPQRPGEVVTPLGALADKGWDFYADDAGWAVAGYVRDTCEQPCTTTFQLVSSTWKGEASTVDLQTEVGPADSGDGAAIVGRTAVGLAVHVPGALIVAAQSVVSTTPTPNVGLPCVVDQHTVFASVADGTLLFTDTAHKGATIASFPFTPPSKSEMLCTALGIVWSTPQGRASVVAKPSGVVAMDEGTAEPVARSKTADGHLTRLTATGSIEVLDGTTWKETNVQLALPKFPSYDYGGWTDRSSVVACVGGIDEPPELGKESAVPRVSCDTGQQEP